MFVKDILPDLPNAIGQCTNEYAYRRLTDAVRLLTSKSLINSQIGEITVCVCGNFATLPAEVQTPVGITVDGIPAIIRDEWFSYHINGPGDTAYTPFPFSDILGNDFPTIRDPDKPLNLAAQITSPTDNNKMLRVFGWDENGDRIMSTNSDGNKEDGFLVPTLYGKLLTNSDVPPIAKIDRVYKDTTSDQITMYGVDPDTDIATTLLGKYRPNETLPAYTRIRTPATSAVRVKYKRRVFEIVDQYDWIPVDNREALIHAIRAVKYRLDGKYTNGAEAETEASRLLMEENNALRPAGIKPPQTINNELPRQTAGSSMFYGGFRNGWSRGN